MPIGVGTVVGEETEPAVEDTEAFPKAQTSSTFWISIPVSTLFPRGHERRLTIQGLPKALRCAVYRTINAAFAGQRRQRVLRRDVAVAALIVGVDSIAAVELVKNDVTRGRARDGVSVDRAVGRPRNVWAERDGGGERREREDYRAGELHFERGREMKNEMKKKRKEKRVTTEREMRNEMKD